MSDVMHKKINQIAFSNFGKEITKENYDDWLVHWFQTILVMQGKYKKENLTKTVDLLNLIFHEQLNVISKREYDIVKNKVKFPQSVH